MLKYTNTPVIELVDEMLVNHDLQLLIKREDLNHPFSSGNKWWKLKYNLVEAQNKGYETVLTFGGAFSNHIYATAAAAKEAGLKSIGIIRGEEALPLNETLGFAKACGMQLQYISREEYRHKSDDEFKEKLTRQFGRFFLIPEGGTNQFAVKGCAEFAKQKLADIDFDFLCVPVGTGGTIAGLICGLEATKKVIGFSVLKNGEFLKGEIENLIHDFSRKQYDNWRIETSYHFGGYAKRTSELDQFMAKIKTQHNLPLDFVYTAKMMAGTVDLISKNHFPKGSKILAIHTGGLRN